MSEIKQPITLAISGASGSIYALRTARALLLAGFSLDVIISPSAEYVLNSELKLEGSSFREQLSRALDRELTDVEYREHGHQNVAAGPASGSYPSAGMVIVPCSMKSLAGVASGYANNLIERAADVTLKEQRPLILVVRETPMNLIHLRNQVAAAEAGATILPAAPAFYQQPETFNDLADFIAGRILNLLGADQKLFTSWEGDDVERTD